MTTTWASRRNVARMYYLGFSIFGLIAILCVVAYFVQQKRRREWERSEGEG